MISIASWPFLILAAAAAVPVIIHFIMRRRMRTVIFPSTALFTLIARREGMRSRVASIVLLIVRIAMIIVIACTAAQLFFSMPGAASSSNWYFLVDNSPSTERETKNGRIIDAIISRADAVGKRLFLQAGTSITIVSPDSVTHTTGYASFAASIRALTNGGPFTLADAMRRALEHAGENRVSVPAMMLFSDAAPSVFSNAYRIEKRTAVYFPKALDEGNAAVIDAVLPKKILFARTVIPLTVNVGRSRYSGGTLRASIGRSLVSTAAVPAGDGVTSVRLPVNIRTPGISPLVITLDSDRCNGDNTYFIAVPTVDRYSIRIAGDADTADRIRAILPSDAPGISVTDGVADALIMIAAPGARMTAAPVRIIIPSADARSADIAALLSPRSFFGAVNVRDERSTVTLRAGPDDMYGSIVSGDNTERIGHRFVVSASPSVDTPIIADDGTPVLLIARDATQRAFNAFFAVPYERENDAFYSSAAFVVLINRLLADAFILRSAVFPCAPGDRPEESGVSFSSNGMDMQAYTAERFHHSGFYRTQKSIYAVNPPSDERRYGRYESTDILPNVLDTTQMTDDEAASRIRSGTDLTPVLIAIFLLLLALEIVLSTDLRLRDAAGRISRTVSPGTPSG